MTDPSSHPITEVAAFAGLAASGGTVEAVTRPLLELMHRVSGLDSTYLTRIDWDENLQHIVYARNAGSITIPEGLAVEWGDTLCRRALDSGNAFCDDVPGRWGDSDAARDLGLQTYVSVPVRLPDDTIYGTLCGASGSVSAAGDALLPLMELFARVIADQIARERTLDMERERAARAEQRIKERSEFLAKAEHMLKTPLAIVMGWADTIERAETMDDAMRRKGIEMIATNARRLRDQVDALLVAARNEILATELHTKTLDGLAELTAAAESFSRASRNHLVVLDDATPPMRMLADPRALHQVLGHLIENAIKYSPDGGTITLRGENGGSTVRIVVDDEGIGIPDDVDVFEPFTQGEETQPGVGLGLHIVRELTQAMGGRVTAERLDKGSRFVVELPAQSA